MWGVGWQRSRVARGALVDSGLHSWNSRKDTEAQTSQSHFKGWINRSGQKKGSSRERKGWPQGLQITLLVYCCKPWKLYCFKDSIFNKQKMIVCFNFESSPEVCFKESINRQHSNIYHLLYIEHSLCPQAYYNALGLQKGHTHTHKN